MYLIDELRKMHTSPSQWSSLSFLRRTGTRFGAVLVAVTILTSLQWAISNSSVADAQVSMCSNDVQFFGAPGSGENPKMDGSMGPEVEAIRDSLNILVAKAGGTVGITPINYVANPVSLIFSDMQKYFDGLASGVDYTMNKLDQFAADSGCNESRVVLGGYSQGAMVMHRVLKRLEDKRYDALRARVDGAVLIADGDKIADDRAPTYGTAGKGTHGLGIDFPAFSGSGNTKFSSKWGSRISSVCTSGDILCSYGKVLAPIQLPIFRAAGGMDIHTSYASKYLADVQLAVSRIKIAIPTIKPVYIGTKAASGKTYTALELNLPAIAGRGCTVQVTTRSTPAGLYISDNYLRGTPTKTGSFKISLSMKSTCPYPRKSATASATVQLTITEGTPPPDPGRDSYEVNVGQFYDSGKENCTDPNFVGYVAQGADQLKALGLTIVNDCRAFYGTANRAGFADWALGHRDAKGQPVIDPRTGKPQLTLFRLIAVNR